MRQLQTPSLLENMQRFLKISILFVAALFLLPAFSWTTITVQNGQTIDGIAAKYTPSGVSRADMMIALRSANPGLGAGLKFGTKLRVPTTQVDVREAITGRTTTASTSASTSSAVVKPKKLTPPSPPPPPVSPKVSPPPVAVSTQTQTNNTVIIHNLQQALMNQSLTLQTYQAQIADLTKQLSTKEANGQIAAPYHFISIENIWFLLGLITLFVWWRNREKHTAETHSTPPVREMPRNFNRETPPTEPVIATSVPQSPTSSRVEPSLHAQEDEESWRQVELDIPLAIPPQTQIQLEPVLNPEQPHPFSNEQRNIINAIANDHDNVEWHLALLEFYVKTNNDAGFERHMHTMTRTGLMIEGDKLWEKIRKMYLNHWIYKGEE